MTDPLGVCSINDVSGTAVVCPVRFRQDWLVSSDAASFFFEEGTAYKTLKEVRLLDGNGKSAGNIDMVLVAHDLDGKIIDFGSVEIQAVYISGNIRRPFDWYMENPTTRGVRAWPGKAPRADYLSSSRKRLIPQLAYKGRLLSAWGKKQAVVLHTGFFDTLPALDEVPEEEADLVWLVYDLQAHDDFEQLQLSLVRKVFTRWIDALVTVGTPSPAPETTFLETLQRKLDALLAIK